MNCQISHNIHKVLSMFLGSHHQHLTSHLSHFKIWYAMLVSFFITFIIPFLHVAKLLSQRHTMFMPHKSLISPMLVSRPTIYKCNLHYEIWDCLPPVWWNINISLSSMKIYYIVMKTLKSHIPQDFTRGQAFMIWPFRTNKYSKSYLLIWSRVVIYSCF